MEPEQLREIVKENNSLETKLTKRNQQYIFDLKKSLEAANLSEEEKVKALHDILPTLVAEQKGGKTARQLFGTVSERTEDYRIVFTWNNASLWLFYTRSRFCNRWLGLLYDVQIHLSI